MENRTLTAILSIPARANPRFASLSRKEADGRIIGGDQADLRFWGFTVCSDRTEIVNPELIRGNFDGWTASEINDYGASILAESYASIGAECIERN